MKKIVLDISWILILGHLLTNVNALISYFWPVIEHKEVDWFWSPHYHMKMVIAWYIKFFTESVLWISTFYVLAKVSYQYSTALFLVAVIFFFYHIFDCLLFWWNFRQNHLFYAFLLWAAIVMIIQAIYPFRQETLAKIKSLF